MRPMIVGAAAALCFAAPAHAEVFQKAENGFVIRLSADVKASAEDAWAALVKPSEWWSKQHTWSGDAANLSVDPPRRRVLVRNPP